MSLSVALGIAQNSLLNTQRQINVVSRNISDAANPDYARRSAILSSLAPGSRIVDIQRATNAALFRQNLSALSGWTAQNAIVAGMEQLSISVLGVENASSPAVLIGDLQEAIQIYSAAPGNRTLAENAVEAARAVVRTFWEPQLGALELAAPDAKSVLQEWAQGRRLPLPRYLEVAREGPDHAPRFTAEVQIEGVAPERGQGTNKREAEQAAALAMLLREGVWQAPQSG